MHARVSTYTGPSERLDEFTQGLERVSDALQQLTGFQGAYGLVDRSSGNAMTIVLFDNEQNAVASTEDANRMRSKVAQNSGQTVQSVQMYEVGTTVGAGRTS